jgi:hypothetical protein
VLQRPPVSGTCPDWCGANGPLRKSERIGMTANPPPSALCVAHNWKLIGMLTGAAPDCGLLPTARRDFSHPWVVCRSSKTEKKGGVGMVAPRLDF